MIQLRDKYYIRIRVNKNNYCDYSGCLLCNPLNTPEMGNVDLINCRSLAKYTRLFGMPDSIVQAYIRIIFISVIILFRTSKHGMNLWIFFHDINYNKRLTSCKTRMFYFSNYYLYFLDGERIFVLFL